MRTLILLLLLLLSFNVTANDDRCNTAIGVYAQGKLLFAAQLFLMDAVDNKNGCSAFQLGMMFHYGHGVRKDKALSAQWINSAREYGFDKAQLVVIEYSNL